MGEHAVENDFGVELFERSVVGLEPTDSAKILFEKCSKIIEFHDELMTSFSNSVEDSYKTIRISVASSSH